MKPVGPSAEDVLKYLFMKWEVF